MFNYNADTAIILGAGFSKTAELPLQNEFSHLLMSADFNSPLDLTITNAIIDFLRRVFGWRQGDTLPSLEDIFTMIDLSSGTGHSLGRTYTPKKLRAIRRMLIYRIFSILDSSFSRSNAIERLFAYYLPPEGGNLTHFVVLNWDIVLERHLEYIDRNPKIDYCVQSKPWANDYGLEPPVAIAKVHGSSNWVYCDNCRSLFYDRNRKLSLSIRAGLIKSDFRLFDEGLGGRHFDNAIGITENERKCKVCNCAVGPHIATFSFRKSFRTHAFTNSWLAAEQILDKARTWVFIGYSLPNADFEFKHLLKTAQLKKNTLRNNSKRIHVVVLNDIAAQGKYEAIFGRNAIKVFQGGLEEYVNWLY